MNFANDNHLKEKLEILDGTRGRGTKSRAAVRRSELEPLVRLSRQLKSKIVDGVPTKDDYNNLLADVKMIHDILAQLAAIQQGQLQETSVL